MTYGVPLADLAAGTMMVTDLRPPWDFEEVP
jgi:hypothetical protein